MFPHRSRSTFLFSLAKIAPAFALLASSLSAVAHGEVIATQDFDGDELNLVDSTISVDDSGWAPGDMFGVRSRSSVVGGNGLPYAITDDSVEGSAVNGVYTPDTAGIVGQEKPDNFFGVVDTANDLNSDPVTASWTFAIDGATDLSLGVDVGAMGDFEASNDSYTFSISIDGGPAVEVLAFVADEDASHTYNAMDSGAVSTFDDPLVSNDLLNDLVDGVVLDKTDPTTGELQTFVIDLASLGTGDELTLIFEAESDGGSEAFAFDNIVIEGTPTAVPEPGSLLLFVIAGLVAIAFRRK